MWLHSLLLPFTGRNLVHSNRPLQLMPRNCINNLLRLSAKGFWLHIWDKWEPKTYGRWPKLINLCVFLPLVAIDKCNGWFDWTQYLPKTINVERAFLCALSIYLSIYIILKKICSFLLLLLLRRRCILVLRIVHTVIYILKYWTKTNVKIGCLTTWGASTAISTHNVFPS